MFKLLFADRMATITTNRERERTRTRWIRARMPASYHGFGRGSSSGRRRNIGGKNAPLPNDLVDKRAIHKRGQWSNRLEGDEIGYERDGAYGKDQER